MIINTNNVDYPSIARLGRAYREGWGVEKDYAKAIELEKIAVSAGIKWAKYDLLDTLLKERSVNSIELFWKEIKHRLYHDSELLIRCGRAFRDGIGVPRDDLIARFFFERACYGN